MTSEQDRELQEKLLEALIESAGDREEACKKVGISRKTFFRWMEEQSFRERFDQYRLRLAEDIENEAIKRVLKGKGQKGSDNLLKVVLEGMKPERYRKDGAQLGVATVVYVSRLRDEPRPGQEVLDADIRHLPDSSVHQGTDAGDRGDPRDSGASGGSPGAESGDNLQPGTAPNLPERRRTGGGDPTLAIA